MQLLPNGKQTFLDGNGNPLANGKVYFYQPNTSTPATTYQDAGGQTANPNPVVLDGNGQAIIYGTGSYRQVVEDANGVTIWDQTTTAPDSGFVSLGQTGTGNGANMVGYLPPGTGAIARTVQGRLQDFSVNVKDFGAKGDGSTDDTTAIQTAINSIPVTGGEVVFPPGVYMVSAAIKGKTNLRLHGFRAGRDYQWTCVTLKASAAAACLDLTDCDHYLIDGIRFDGNNVAPAGIKQGYTTGSTHVAHSHLLGVTVQNVTGTGIDTGSANPGGATNDCVYEKVIIETCGLGYDFYSTNNMVLGGAVAGCTTTGGARFNTSSETNIVGTVFSGNKVDYLFAGNDFINGVRSTNVWFEQSTGGIVSRPTVPSVTAAVGSLVFTGCNFHTASSNTTAIMDFTNMSGNFEIIGGRLDPAAGSVNVKLPTGTTLHTIGVSQDFTRDASSAGRLININANGIQQNAGSNGAYHLADNLSSNYYGTLAGDATSNAAWTIGWNRSGGDGELNIINAKGGGAAGGIKLQDWDGTTLKDLFNVQRDGQMVLNPPTATTVGAAGTAAALPTNPIGYVQFKIGTTAYKFPYYAA